MMRRIKGNGADGEDDLRDGFSVAAQPAASPLDSIVGVAAVAGAADEDEHDDSDDEVHSEQPLSAPAGAAVSAAATSKEDKESMSTAKIPFPWKLHTLLERASDEDFEDIVSWEAGGKAFRVHKPKEFCDTIMPKYFRQSKFESFTRQLYIYGFSKVEKKGPSQGAFSHPYFLRDNKELSLSLGRNQVADRRRKRQPPPTSNTTAAGTGTLQQQQQQQQHRLVASATLDAMGDDDIASVLLQGQSRLDHLVNPRLFQQQLQHVPNSLSIQQRQQQQTCIGDLQQQTLPSSLSLQQQSRPSSWDTMSGDLGVIGSLLQQQQQQTSSRLPQFNALQQQVRRSSLSQQLALTSSLQLQESINNISPIRSSRLVGSQHLYPSPGSALLEAETRLNLTGSPSHSISNESKKDPLDDHQSSAAATTGIASMIKWDRSGLGDASTPPSTATSGAGMVQWPDLEPRSIEEMIARPLQGNERAGSSSNSNPGSEHNTDNKDDNAL